jgi:hypothetical protein
LTKVQPRTEPKTPQDATNRSNNWRSKLMKRKALNIVVAAYNRQRVDGDNGSKHAKEHGRCKEIASS